MALFNWNSRRHTIDERLDEIGDQLNTIGSRLDSVGTSLNQLLTQGTKIMSLLDDAKAALAEETGTVSQVKALVTKLLDEVASAGDMTAVQDIVTQWRAANHDLASLVTQDTGTTSTTTTTNPSNPTT